MTRVFADTSFYQALLNPHDRWHGPALQFSERYSDAIVTTEYILVELGALMSRGFSRELFVEFVERVQADSNTAIITASTEHFSNGFRLFAKRRDKDWSLTDCISFAVMEHMRIRDAVSCDKHFEQAGYRQLLALT